jgi:hypothetical protein
MARHGNTTSSQTTASAEVIARIRDNLGHVIMGKTAEINLLLQIVRFSERL